LRLAAARHPGQLKRLSLLGLMVAAVLPAACGSSSSSSSKSSTGTTSATTATTAGTGPTQPGGGTVGPERIPIEQGTSLAPATTTGPGNTVDGIQCAPIEQLAYHIHAHLQIYVNGQPRQLPGGIGLVTPMAQQTPAGPFYGATKCYYWLHTHTADGVLHIESPTARIYTLGDFFDEWRQPLTPHQVAGAHGAVTAFVDGKPWTRSPRDIPLKPRAQIQLNVGSPSVPFHGISWDGSGL
jgi:hypothetical protein